MPLILSAAVGMRGLARLKLVFVHTLQWVEQQAAALMAMGIAC
ncbi:hypothetical protein [Thermogemmatispora carboxidivorans]|nr:hypothetical protein [Thermogemmatispora carboxidivorans]